MLNKISILSLVTLATACANTSTNPCASAVASTSEASSFCATATSDSAVPDWASSCSTIKNVLKECICQFSTESVTGGNNSTATATTAATSSSSASTKTQKASATSTLVTSTKSSSSGSSATKTSGTPAATSVSSGSGSSSGNGTASTLGLIGYAVGTTGGGSGTGTTVSSCADLKTALASSGVVRISGTLDSCGILDVSSDTSVIGVGTNSGMTNGGLRIKEQSNVIIQNLKMHNPPEGGDLIALQEATMVWLDHLALTTDSLASGDKDLYDGMIDITHASDLVTVSYSTFANHFKVSLIGHSDSNEAEDTGHLQVTYHHNYFHNVSSRVPSIRFGTGHILNNCYETVSTSGVHSRMNAKVLVEGNSFTDVKRAIVTNLDSEEDGFAVDKNNVFVNSETSITQSSDFTPPYEYTAEDATGICDTVKAQAGTSASL